MTVKELRDFIKDLPDEMPVLVFDYSVWKWDRAGVAVNLGGNGVEDGYKLRSVDDECRRRAVGIT